MSDVLVEALAALRSSLSEFSREVPLSAADPAQRLKELRKVVQGIGYERPFKPPHCPDEYRKQWRDFVAGRRGDLERAAVRFLCWEPEVATDARFHDYFDQAGLTLTPRGLQGLVASTHQRWSKDLINGPVGKSLRKRLRSYSGVNQRVFGWQRELKIVAGGEGPALLGGEIIKEKRPIKEAAAGRGFFEDTAFMRHAVAAATDLCCKQVTADSPLTMFLTDQLLGWNGWEQGAFKDEFSSCTISPQAASLEQLREGLKRLALDKLGDPRLPVNAGRWMGVRKAAHDEFLKWLSHDDITFFFEHVLPRGSDPHGRKNFWLRYVGRVKRSRPLLCQVDEHRLRNLERRSNQRVGHYGKIEGLTSAFLLDFDKVLVVEFSAYGNACFVYERSEAAQVVPEFWRMGPFSRTALRVRELASRLAHKVGWQETMSQYLAGHGIYPGVQGDGIERR